MDEPAAIALADEVVRSQFDGRFERLSASRVDAEAFKSSYEEDWREGRFPAGVTEAEFREFTQSLDIVPYWIVGYLLYLEDGVTVGSVIIDEATGATEWDVHPRPSE
ncbi:MAG: hypothetical protein P4L85_11100 [Paludisphaera borealis]|uniref:hypothetical protein n=1 Tax=Paludisphaera borealis TaxID=1387353 RepID=UPI00283FA56D|nr:hypothetical protein [Paludisphaera borealis]MDR3619886.1 hypothetical protein [Paludisphaera borealis]